MRDEFDHERLEVYRRAVRMREVADGVAARMGGGRQYAADQLRRAALSVPLNIAEGAGEFSRKEKARFYRMAKRSASECAALLDAAGTFMRTSEENVEPRRLLLEVTAMLTRMIRNLEAQK